MYLLLIPGTVREPSRGTYLCSQMAGINSPPVALNDRRGRRPGVQRQLQGSFVSTSRNWWMLSRPSLHGCTSRPTLAYLGTYTYTTRPSEESPLSLRQRPKGQTSIYGTWGDGTGVHTEKQLQPLCSTCRRTYNLCQVLHPENATMTSYLPPLLIPSSIPLLKETPSRLVPLSSCQLSAVERDTLAIIARPRY